MENELFVKTPVSKACFKFTLPLVCSVMLRLQVVTVPFLTIIFIFTSVFQSIGKATAAFILSLSHQGILFIPIIFILKKFGAIMV